MILEKKRYLDSNEWALSNDSLRDRQLRRFRMTPEAHSRFVADEVLLSLKLLLPLLLLMIVAEDGEETEEEEEEEEASFS